MTQLPKVVIGLQNGGLGVVAATMDGVAGLVLSGQAVSEKIDINEPRQIFSVRDLDALGIDSSNNPLADKEIKAFYSQAGDGAELWLILYSESMLLEDVCDGAESNRPVQKLMDAAGGRIRLLGVNRKPPAEYTPTITGNIDEDVTNAAVKLQSLLVDYADNYKPVRAFLPAIGFTGSGEGLVNLRQSSQNRVGVVVGSDVSTGEAAVGVAIGRASSVPVMRNLGRVKDGAMIVNAWLTDGTPAAEKETLWPLLHENGFVFLRSYQGKNGFYFNDDPMMAPASDDYAALAMGRVIDKAIVIAYTTYVDELLDNVEIDQEGKLAASACKYFESRINNAVNTLMAGEISGFESFVNPSQNVLSTSKLTVACAITPLGTLRQIVVELGFSNPALEQ